ncbi:MAG: hypothetical protein LBS28_01705 [Streptococcaceae bacterium]|jgi:predicted transposase/invertase (TIGR01784 family)|nr:hypothetical protein [Streptococcaceae bacterium]
MFDVITSDKQIQELLRMKEKGERDFNSAMKNSEIRGIEKGLKKTALSMLTDVMPISTINKDTGLSISKIKSLKLD